MRMTRVVWRRTLRAAAVAAAVQSTLAATVALFPRIADAAPVTWVGGNADWIEGGSTALWNPADEPDFDDTAIFNTGNSVNLGSNNSVLGLTMSGGIDLNTNNFTLAVDGLAQLSGANTNLVVGGAGSLLLADFITINSGANVELNGGTIQINDESGNGLLDINAGGALVGHGTLTMGDAVGVATTLIVNDGAITARRAPLVLLGPPQVGTLTLAATDVDTRIDLDGAGEAGVVNVNRNQTLNVNIQMSDAFNGTINLFQDATLSVSTAWGLGTAGTINVDNGFVDSPSPLPDIPAGIATITGATFTQSSGTINVVDTDGTLVIPGRFNMTGGTFNNNGHTIFNGIANIETTATFNMGPSGSDLTVGANADVTINQNSFNLDGTAPGTVITVQQGGVLTLALGDYDNDSATNVFDATITLSGGLIDLTTADAEFVMGGVLNMNSVPGGIAGWLGEPVDIGNDAGALDAKVNVTGTGGATAQIGAQIDFNSDADVNVAAGGNLTFLTASTVNFHTVNGANNARFTGAGTIEFNGAVNVVEAVTLDMSGGTVDLDGFDSVGETINVDAPFTINAATLSSFGRANGVGTNLLDVNNSAGTGVLTVNLDNPTSEWTLNAPGVMNLVNDNTAATLLAGSAVNLNGTLNVAGDVRVTSRVDIAGIVNINTAAEPLRLAGGDATNNPNTIAGGTISGAGVLGADDGKVLRGFGTINTGIDFDGSARFQADNGTLTINGAILDAGTVGTADVDGILHVTNAWNTNVTTGVQLNGGRLSGGTITNDATAGISGHGLVTARVINNSQLFASLGDTLIFQTAANDNDWDGTTNAGEIEATQANIELRDAGAAFGFTGMVRATNNHTAFANGFALDFNPGSTLVLATGGTYRANSSTDIGGVVSVGTGGATIEVEINNFLSFESGSATTLNSNLRLVNNNIIIEAGATFSGTGALVIPDGSHMVGENLSSIGVLLDMRGAMRPGNSQGIGRVNLFDFQQSDSSELFIELTGTSLNAFDRLVASGDVVVDGFLSLDIDDISPGVPFVPVLGNTFNIITGNTVTGEFDYADVSGMPAGLAFRIEYLSNAVQLQVVTKPIFSADFDDDGDVDVTDLEIWRGAYDLNQLGDADGDNDSDGADLILWQRQFGSSPGSGASPGSETAVPEPSSLAGLLMACFACARPLGRHRRRAARASNQGGSAL